MFNCAGITKCGQDDDVYKENVLQISVLCSAEAGRRNVRRFVELSTAHVYAADKVSDLCAICSKTLHIRKMVRMCADLQTPSIETAKTDPWTKIAAFKLQAEARVASVPGYVKVRELLDNNCQIKPLFAFVCPSWKCGT